MSLSTTLWLRIMLILLGGFVLLQLLMLAALPLIPGERRPSQLPQPAQVAAMLDLLEPAPARQREALIDLLNDSLYTVELQPPGSQAATEAGTSDNAPLEQEYAAALPGRSVRVTGRGSRFAEPAMLPWAGRVISPLTLSVTLRDGSLLRIDTRPSPLLAAYLRQRALIGAVGALLLLLTLAFALRRTTQPLRSLSRHIRDLPDALNGPDMIPAGTNDVKALTVAFNDMKARIAVLIAERTRLLAAIAHDLRTYLTRLRLRADFIGDEDQRRRAIADLDEMSALLDDTLLIAKPVEARPPSHVALADELETFVAHRQEMNEAVTLSGPTADCRVQIARTDLRRILNNLVDNGLRYGKQVTINADTVQGRAEITIFDDGPGVPPETLSLLGRAYYRVDPSRDRASGGAGLGLAIVCALIERHGGSVAFASRPEGGFEARLSLPCAPPAT